VASWADTTLWGYTVAACKYAGASVTHEHALETREPSCVPRAAKTFFIPMVHSPLGAMGHMTTPELPSQEGRAPSHGACGSTGVPLLGRQSPEPWGTWWHWSSPQQGGEVWGRGTRGSTRAHLSKEVRFRAEGHVAAPELTSVRRRGPGLWGTWRLRSPPP
jgi:hypothetical protein